ncbi:MAG: hypothetical protein WDW38_002958 [Sanguina aurantia]
MAAFMPYVSLGSAVLYGGLSISMNFVNKYTMQIFPLSNCILIMQMAATFVILWTLRQLRVIEFPPFSAAKCRRFFGISVLYTANTGFALFGLKTLNIPMYNVLKRMTPVMVLCVKACALRRWPPMQITMSVMMVVAGCLVAGVGDLSFDMVGYACAFASCAMQAAYLLLVEFQGSATDTSELLYYNSITSLPLLIPIAYMAGELPVLSGAWAAAIISSGSVWLAAATIASCSLMGMLLNYALFLCTQSNSALTTTIVGVLKGVVAVALGFFLLGGIKTSFWNTCGIVINTLGGSTTQ